MIAVVVPLSSVFETVFTLCINEGKRLKKDSAQVKPIKLDTRPLYAQTIEAMMDLLANGGLNAGDKLPTEAELAQQLGISRSTLRVALGYLENRGYISRRTGIGTFVAAPVLTHDPEGFLNPLDRLETILEYAERSGFEVSIFDRETHLTGAEDEAAVVLGVSPEDQLVHWSIVVAIKNRRGAYLEFHVPSGLVDIDEIKIFEGDLVDYLSSIEEIKPVHTQSRVFAEKADVYLANKLDIELNEPVLYLQEIFFNSTGQTVAFAKNYFLTDIFSFYLIRKIST
jgi:GntR family transcriptional regulator